MINFSWELFFGVGIVLLAIALVWGLSRNRSRNRANDRVTEEATRAQYDHSDERYRQADRPAAEQKLQAK